MDTRWTLPANTVLDGSYRIVQVVGLGGFGITYEAEDLNLATRIAIKEYYPVDFGDRDATMSVKPKSDRHKKTFDWGRSNFLQEARTLARFEHPSIVRVTRVFEANSTAYMVMRFERGRSLEDWLKELGRPPAQEELDRIVAPLLDALEMLHAANFLHRDIAPDNIIIRPDGTPVLLDFGASRRAVAVMSQSLTGIVKAGYSPHEQYSSDGRLQGPWSDFYAFGGTLYRAVVGNPPDEAMLRVDEDHMAPAVKAAKGDYRRSFLAGIDACLTVRPSERPRSVAELRTMFLERKAATPRRNRLEAGSAGDQPSAEALPRPRARAGWAIAAAIIALMAGAYGGYEYTRWQPAGRGVEDAAAAQRAAEAARQRQAEIETERKRQEMEAARRRQAELEAERKRQEMEASRRRQAELEAERKRQEEAARSRQAEVEAERKRQEEEAARRKQAELEAERKRQEAEAERSRQAELERQRQAEADEAARRTREAEERERKTKEEERIALLPKTDVEPHPGETASGEVLIPRQDGTITAIATDGQWIAIGTDKGTVQLWQLSEGSLAKQVASNGLHAGARISALALSTEDGVRIAASDLAGRLAFWEVQSNAVHRTPAPSRDKRVFALRYDGAAKQIMAISVTRSKGNAYEATVEHWRPDGRSAEAPKPIDTGGRPIEAGAFGPKGDLLAVAAGLQGLAILEPGRGSPLLKAPVDGFVHALTFSPDGRRLAIGGQFDQIRLWEDSEGHRFGQRTNLDLKEQRTGDSVVVTALVFSPDGRFLASATFDDKIALWDTQSPARLLAEYEGRRQTSVEPIKWLSLLPASPGKILLLKPWSDGSVRRMAVAAGK